MEREVDQQTENVVKKGEEELFKQAAPFLYMDFKSEGEGELAELVMKRYLEMVKNEKERENL